ncbi:cytochrome P450 [Jannaschia sp. 2305UL9-9]|uniref:cytochrome P450 n=1 Tax=Jannaschia sp. 2305UL9-9 TaxID=3121638 RepID=UPI003527DD22
MQIFHQSPTDPAFVQNPYPFYERLRAAGPLSVWADNGMPVASSHEMVNALLRNRRFGREDPAPPPRPPHQAGFWAIEDHSMLELEAPRHTRLRGSVLRAFTSGRIRALQPQIAQLASDLIDDFPSGPFDLLDAFARPLPVRVIARFLGVPEGDAPHLLRWSNAMVGMYQANRTHAAEVAAAQAATEFASYLDDIFRAPRPDSLISDLLVLADTEQLSLAEVTATCVLLLNAGHEATVHTIGNGVAGLLSAGLWGTAVTPELIEEVLRHDPPLHMFTRYAMQDVEIGGHAFVRGDRVGLLLGAANRDPLVYDDPNTFDPHRFPDAPTGTSFGAGAHFCIGAPLARLELLEGFSHLADRCPGLTLSEEPAFADIYHFHGLDRLVVTLDRA